MNRVIGFIFYMVFTFWTTFAIGQKKDYISVSNSQLGILYSLSVIQNPSDIQYNRNFFYSGQLNIGKFPLNFSYQLPQGPQFPRFKNPFNELSLNFDHSKLTPPTIQSHQVSSIQPVQTLSHFDSLNVPISSAINPEIDSVTALNFNNLKPFGLERKDIEINSFSILNGVLNEGQIIYNNFQYTGFSIAGNVRKNQYFSIATGQQAVANQSSEKYIIKEFRPAFYKVRTGFGDLKDNHLHIEYSKGKNLIQFPHKVNEIKKYLPVELTSLYGRIKSGKSNFDIEFATNANMLFSRANSVYNNSAFSFSYSHSQPNRKIIANYRNQGEDFQNLNIYNFQQNSNNLSMNGFCKDSSYIISFNTNAFTINSSDLNFKEIQVSSTLLITKGLLKDFDLQGNVQIRNIQFESNHSQNSKNSMIIGRKLEIVKNRSDLYFKPMLGITSSQIRSGDITYKNYMQILGNEVSTSFNKFQLSHIIYHSTIKLSTGNVHQVDNILSFRTQLKKTLTYNFIFNSVSYNYVIPIYSWEQSIVWQITENIRSFFKLQRALNNDKHENYQIMSSLVYSIK